MNEYAGQWQRKGLIRVPVPPEGKPGRPPKAKLWDWSNPDDVKAAHRFFNHGARDLWTVEGERVYQTGRKRVQTARLSEVDRAWCERNAVKFSWDMDTRQNRRMLDSLTT